MSYSSAVIGVGKAGGGSPKGGGHAIGYTHAEMFQSDDRVRLVAGADPHPDNLRAFQTRFNVNQCFASAAAMFREIRPDLVSIGTYVGLHREMIELAARAGVKGIVCEKPFLASIPQCEAVRKLAAETGVKIVVAHVRRYRPAFIRARELFNNGSIGTPICCISGIKDWDLSEWGSHWLDIFRFFNHDRPILWAMGQARVIGCRGYGHAMEDHAVAHFEFDNGVRGILDGGRATNAGDAALLLVGTEGTIRIEGETKLILHDKIGQHVENHPQSRRGGETWSGLWSDLLADLIRWIEGGPEPVLGLSNMLKTSELNLGAYISARRGDRVDFPINDIVDEWPVEELARRNRRS
jgi:UDP-N-acetylglucosamine 3-dehydrogenase